MNRMRKYFGMFFFVMLWSVSPLFADVVEIRVATLFPSGSSWMKFLNKAAEEIKTKTAGFVNVKYYSGGSQGDERDFIRKINLGQLDGADLTSVGLSMIDESIRVLDVPMMFASPEEFDYVADKMWPIFQARFEKKGFKLHGRGEFGWVYMFSKTKILSMADLRSQTVWQRNDDQPGGALLKKLGLNLVPLGFLEVEPSLITGRISTVFSSPLLAVALQWHPKVKFMASMPISYAFGGMVTSLDSMKKLKAEEFKSFESIYLASSKQLRKDIRKENETAKATMVRKGLEITETPSVMITEFNKASEEIRQALVGKVYSKEDLESVMKLRSEYRAKKNK